jgi:siroheme synthase-like protein
MPDSPDRSATSTPRDLRFAYPVFLDLHEVPVLVVGGGPVGVRKAAGLLAAGARVRVVASRASDAISALDVDELIERPFEERDLDGVRLVVTATGVESTDRAIADAARARGVWVNAADQPDDCEFILPAITRAGSISVAVSSDGQSPAMTQYVRDQITPLLDEDVVAVADELARRRQELKAAGQTTEGRDWRPLIDELLAARRARHTAATDMTQTAEPPEPCHD